MLAPPLAVPNHLIGLNDVLRLLFVFWSLFHLLSALKTCLSCIHSIASSSVARLGNTSA